MAYKNSDGNTSIANQWGQWRYFNSAFTKLGEIKATTPSIKPQKTIEEANDWVGAVGASFKALKGVYDARKELADTVADEYLQKHSLEEYQHQMKMGNVPFQDDPLAMSSLKQKHGKILFSAIAQDFQDRVDANEFKGMSPEQVDAEFFKFMKEQSAGVSEAFGYADNDYHFNKGLYSDSPEKRIKMMLRQKTVEDAYQKQQDLIANAAELSALCSHEGVSADLFVSTLANQYLTTGAHEKPGDLLKKVSSGLEILAANPNAGQSIKDLKGREIPGLEGVTFGNILGEEGYKELVLKNANARYASNAQAKLDFQNSLDVMATNSKAPELLALRNSKFKESGGLLTDEVKDIEKAYDAAVKVQLANAKKNAVALKKQQDELVKTSASRAYVQAVARGEPVVSKDVAGLTNKDIDTAYQYLVDTGSITFKDQLAIAKNPHLPFNDNPARKYFTNQASDALKWLNDSTRAFMTSNTFPKEIKDSVNTLIEVYKADPSNFSNIIGSSADKNLEDARALSIMLSSGRPIEDIVRGKAEIQKLKDEGNTKEITKIRDRAIKAIQDPMLGDTKDIDYNGKAFVTTLTFAFRSMGETDRNAVALAEAEYNKSFKNLMGTSVPASFFTGWSGLTVPDKEIIARIKKEIPSKYLTDIDKNVTLSFDTSSNVLTIADRAGNSIFSLSQAEASNLVESIGDEIYKNAEMQEELQDKYPSIVFGEDQQFNDK